MTLPPWLVIPEGWEVGSVYGNRHSIYVFRDGAAFRYTRGVERVFRFEGQRRLRIPATQDEFYRACAYLGGHFLEFLPKRVEP